MTKVLRLLDLLEADKYNDPVAAAKSIRNEIKKLKDSWPDTHAPSVASLERIAELQKELEQAEQQIKAGHK